MNNVIYYGEVTSAKDSPDGESPTSITLTREANGYAIWRSTFEEGTTCVKHVWHASENDLIEEAVGMVLRERAMVRKAA